MTEQFVRKMEEGVKLLGIQLSEKQLEQFYDYFQFLVEKNKVMNLTAITEEDAVITKHFCDSLCLVKGFSDIEKTVSLIDVGTGAGFPGIPLKITFPHLKVTLLDSLNKRVRFLEEVCERLDLENVTCVHARAEDGGRNKDLREKFDLCVSRAVANLSSLSEYCMPFVKVGGYFVPYKSGDIEEELAQAKKAVAILGGEIENVTGFELPGGEGSRSLIKIKKMKPISAKYPRKAGLPGNEPLGTK